MPIPATTGILRTKISEMQIGDYVKCWYSFHPTSGSLTNSAGGILVGLGSDSFSTGGEKPVTGESTASYSKFFYFIKVGKGLVIADRICQNSISWDVLNAGKVIQGKPYSFSTSSDTSLGFASSENISGILRSLTGGVAYSDSSGIMSIIDKSKGAWPINNEWDKFIINFPTNKIQKEKGLNDVFHHNTTTVNWCQDTPVIGISKPSGGIPNPSSNIGRIHRSGIFLDWSQSSWGTVYNRTSQGFRPVFEYREV